MVDENIESELENIKENLEKFEDVSPKIYKTNKDYILFERDLNTYSITSSGFFLKKIIRKHFPVCWTPDKEQFLVMPFKLRKKSLLLNFDYFRSFAARRPSKKNVIRSDLDYLAYCHLRFSSSGKLIAYVTKMKTERTKDVERKLELYVSDRQGNNIKNVSRELHSDVRFRFSPDDKYVAYYHSSGLIHIYDMTNNQTTSIKDIQSGSSSSNHEYSHDSIELVDWINNKDMLVFTNIMMPELVTRHNEWKKMWMAPIDFSSRLKKPSLSPNKKYLSGITNGRLVVSEILPALPTYQIPRIKYQEISADKAINYSWSPDSNKLVYDNGENIYVTDLRGNNNLLLKNGSNPLWSPGR